MAPLPRSETAQSRKTKEERKVERDRNNLIKSNYRAINHNSGFLWRSFGERRRCRLLMVGFGCMKVLGHQSDHSLTVDLICSFVFLLRGEYPLLFHKFRLLEPAGTYKNLLWCLWKRTECVWWIRAKSFSAKGIHTSFNISTHSKIYLNILQKVAEKLPRQAPDSIGVAWFCWFTGFMDVIQTAKEKKWLDFAGFLMRELSGVKVY